MCKRVLIYVCDHFLFELDAWINRHGHTHVHVHVNVRLQQTGGASRQEQCPKNQSSSKYRHIAIVHGGGASSMKNPRSSAMVEPLDADLLKDLRCLSMSSTFDGNDGGGRRGGEAGIHI